jgi:hypothetical protein
MVRIAKQIDFKRIEELKEKINDEDYLKQAIQLLAQALTKNLFEKDSR